MIILKKVIDKKRLITIYLVILLLSFFIHFFIDYIVNFDSFFKIGIEFYVGWNLLTLPLTNIINFIIVFFFNKSYWNNKLIVRIIFEAISSLFAINFIVFLGTFFIKGMVAFWEISQLFEARYFYSNAIENLIVILFIEIIYSFQREKERELKLERSYLENERYKYNQLKSQVNPHFLFNSLNILAAMVYKKKDEESGEYIEKLSDVYRYVLTNEEKKVITLKSEIEFIEKYIGILKSRFREGLIFEIDISKDVLDRFVPTMSLQLLVENCIKHNIVSKEKPIIIKIYSEGDFIIVSNNKNLREEEVVTTGIGLNNLNERYKLVANKSIEIINKEGVYKVKIPLI
ncbi:MAG: yehU 6 [Bacteroidetes bacterium]|nr:yehU 6 [Bacteroidota bacterium]